MIGFYNKDTWLSEKVMYKLALSRTYLAFFRTHLFAVLR
jgi:hypothetical protein